MGHGVGYLEVDPLPKMSFGQQLGAAINYRFQEHANVFNAVSNLVAGSKVVGECKPAV